MGRPRKHFPVWHLKYKYDTDLEHGEITGSRKLNTDEDFDKSKPYFIGDELVLSHPLGSEYNRLQIWKGRVIQPDTPTFYEMYLLLSGNVHGQVKNNVTRARMTKNDRADAILPREGIIELKDALIKSVEEDLNEGD